MTSKDGTVLFLEHEASRTGASIFLLRLLSWLRTDSNFDFRILAGRWGELLPEFRSVGMVDAFEPEPKLAYRFIRRLKSNNWQQSKHLHALREKLAQSDIRLIYANSVASARMLDFLSFLQCPVICHVHELNGAIQTLGSQSIHILEKYKPHYIAVSHAVAENLTRKHRIPANRVRVIYGFVPVSEFSPREANLQESIRREIGIPRETKIICGCGSIEHRKGTDIFVEVARTVIRRNEALPAHFVWIGGTPDGVETMRKRLTRLGLTDRVHFIGSKSNVAPYFEAADIFLLTSREDPFPLVMLEAALHKTPIVCFDQTGGAPEFLLNDSGFVVPKFDIEKMSDKVMELLASPHLCKQMGEAARQKVISCHELSLGAQQIANVIGERLGLRSARLALNDSISNARRDTF
ncbi:glycosyltransferase family 4 protein [Bradyrhizobium zhanjiangense]|uniref:Glycosyltransferase family 1 protein n=1 Tax=Bradyrhizobium zhanjiangense TaxID=1325107 RepID=A0ABY0DMS4_9BRAD|nr:glycosyltransferase family 4 protein [Bradyrhizobium zhanjiangense]RXG96249.1 glycosyltransferase family 1 protein [Bradyrhizobium zhanjiangense]